MNEGNDVILSLNEVSKYYGDTCAVDKFSMDIREGEFVTLLGPSGSGKTTILNLVAGMISPTQGSISIGGRNVTDVPSNQRGLGMVFQNYALMPHMSVYDNLAYPLKVRKMDKHEIREKVSDALAMVRLEGMKDRKPNELSGGQQQRVSLARAIIYAPNIVLMDEPLGALDRNLREQMQLEIRRIHNDLGITLMFVTHDQEEALTMSDRIVLMDAGHVVQSGSPTEMYFSPNSLFSARFFGETNHTDGQINYIDGKPVFKASGSGEKVDVRLDTDVTEGTHANLVIRPENVTVEAYTNKDSDGKASTLHGNVRDSFFIAGIAKTYVSLPDETTFVSQRLSNRQSRLFKPGDPVRLKWDPVDAIVFFE